MVFSKSKWSPATKGAFITLDCPTTVATNAYLEQKGPRNTLVPVPGEEKDDDNIDTDIDDSASEDENLTFAAMNIKDNCEYQYLNEPPTNILSRNSIILPITLENNKVKVQTYILLNTGSSFSCISPKLDKILDVKINRLNNGFIKNCRKDNVLDRIGTAEQLFKITYNSRQCSFNSEMFGIFSDMVVKNGIHLFMKIEIFISNMAMDWKEDKILETTPIKTNPYKPNDSPYGTSAEREHILQEIAPYIEENKNIDPKAYCNIPGSTLPLHVLRDHENKMYRPQ
ncbi:hypothetical protein [Parasitella parasitica]|uniref:Uncharacterized protein n=1 Tax=Parasitella parasitica TaxID=35722 RepID=A0A0B7NBJ8_9FUNG|nr:hypothetical protein [Parasitella parasitica]